MTVELPDEILKQALLRLGPRGTRALAMLESAAEHLNDGRGVAAQHAAYALREAIMAIVRLDTNSAPRVGDTASKLVELYVAGVRDDALDRAVVRLREALTGPGPHSDRLERVVASRSRVRPTRALGDRFTQLVNALDRASRWLHADENMPSAEEVAREYQAVSIALKDLLGPISERIAGMDDLVVLESPGPDDVARLRERLGDGHAAAYFFERADGPGWLHALGTDVLLVPPAVDPWVAGAYLARTAESHPADVRHWLRGVPSDLNRKQVADLLWVARFACGDDVLSVALRLARPHLDSDDIRFRLDLLLREASDEQRHSRAARSLIRELLIASLSADSRSHDMYMAAEQAKTAIAAIPTAPDAWLTMLAHRGSEVATRHDILRLRVMRPLPELHLRAARSPLDLIGAALRKAAEEAADAGLQLDVRLARLRLVPEPLGTRLVAQHLSDRLAETSVTAVTFIAEQISRNDWPSPEELALLRELFANDADLDPAPLVAALGPVPTPDRIGTLEADGRPEDLVRPHRWLVAIPEQIAPDWHVADAALETHLGVASSDGVMMRIGHATFAPNLSPIPVEELAAIGPTRAAARVAAWRPAPDASFMDPDAAGLATALRAAIDADVPAWLAEDPVELARALIQPRYLRTLIEALASHVDQLPEPDAAVNLAELVITNPWDPGDTLDSPFDPDAGWSQAGEAAVSLLGQLGEHSRLSTNADRRAWGLITGAVATRPARPSVDPEEPEPLSAALRLPWIRALEAALAFGQMTDGAPSDQLLVLLDEILALDGADGRHARALLATRWPWLRARVPEWFAAHADQIFGDETTFDLYLQYGRVSEQIITEQRDRLVAALRRDQHEPATHHLLHGMFFGVPGLEPATLARTLGRAGTAVIDDTAHWLGTAFSEAGDDIDVAPVAALWRELLRLGLAPARYVQFGWLAYNDHIDDNEWLELTDRTLTAAEGSSIDPSSVAERAARQPADRRAISIVAKLLAGDLPPWEIQRVGAIGLEILTAATGAEADTLRERVLERGFYDARG